jgi:predicted metal-binding transcription factor (methanogenesis marker protein 9)
MNLPDVKQYTHELSALLERADNAERVLHEATALARAAEQANERQQQMQILAQRAQMEGQHKQIVAALLQHARRDDVEGARTLRTDLIARIDLAIEEYTRWRRLLAEFEFRVGEGEFAPEPAEGEEPMGFTRSMAEEELSRAKNRAERRVAMAAAMVPERVVILQ